MRDWQHELRNQLNVVIYATNWAREALAQGRGDDVADSLTRIDEAIAECGGLLEQMDRPASPSTAVLPDQPEAGQAQ